MTANQKSEIPARGTAGFSQPGFRLWSHPFNAIDAGNVLKAVNMLRLRGPFGVVAKCRSNSVY